MSHFILHTKTKGKDRLRYVIAGIACVLAVGAVGYGVHSLGTARAKSRETVEIRTGEELELYLLDRESEEYNLNGRYRLEEDLDLGWLYQSIGNNVEPFTGKFDGNGHVMSGLGRPLFGVMKRAEIENVFISGALITEPFTYYDGERYVDGYGALAAYAVDSRIRNCGMNGEIATASPSEAEYQVAKASPADAGEGKRPGEAVPSEALESSTVPLEGGGVDGTGESVETGTGTETETSGIEAGESGAETGNQEGTAESTGAGPGETGSGENEAGDAGTENDGTEDAGSGNGEAGNGGTGSAGSGNSEAGNGGAGSAGSGNSGAGNTGSGNSGAGNTGSGNSGTENAGSGNSDSGNTGSGAGESGQPEVQVGNTAFVLPANRQRLMLKISELPDAQAEAAAKASPSNGDEAGTDESIQTGPEETGSSGQTGPGETGGSGQNGAGETGGSHETTSVVGVEEETTTEEYIGNPNGDIYILVTADRVTAGGLVSQAGGETLIADSFVLVTLTSQLDEVETYAGGLAGILGDGTRTENSYASGVLSCDDVVGGFAAVNEGSIENSYSSIALGENGRIRGAFTAEGAGRYRGCVYDRQMACAVDRNEDALIQEEEPEEKPGETRENGQPDLSENSQADRREKGPGVVMEENLQGENPEEMPESPEETEEDHTGMIQVGPGEWIETEPAVEEPSETEPQPGADQPAAGQPEAEQLTADQPAVTGQPEADQLTADQPAAGQPEANQPEADQLTASPAQAEFSLKGLNTSQMTGYAAQIPGMWYYSENAYPQLESFALNSQAVIVDSSKASAIALVLPDEYTLSDVLDDGALILPAEIDGQAIQWEAEGSVTIDENNQVHTDREESVPESASLSNHEVPEVGSAIGVSEESVTDSVPESVPEAAPDSASEAVPGSVPEAVPGSVPEAAPDSVPEAVPDSAPEAGPGNTPAEPAGDNGDKSAENIQPEDSAAGSDGDIRIRGSIGEASKSFSISGITRVAAASGEYADWAAVGQAVDSGALQSMKPSQNPDDGYYEIGTPEALSWAAYRVNSKNEDELNIRLTADIDLFGTAYTGVVGAADGSNIDQALLWNPIGVYTTRVEYSGNFDGARHKVSNLRVIAPGGSGSHGLIGTWNIKAGQNLTVKDVAVTSGKVFSQTYAAGIVGLIKGDGGTGQIIRCMNDADVEGGYAGGMVGYRSTTGSTVVIDGCYNQGTVKGRYAGGITGGNSGKDYTIMNCYNQGTILPGNNSYTSGGITGIFNSGGYANNKMVNCYNAGVVESVPEGAYAGGILGNGVGSSSIVQRCFYESSKSEKGMGYLFESFEILPLTESQLKSWAAAYALNGYGMESDGSVETSWTWSSGGYPVLYSPAAEPSSKLAPASSWEVVGQGVADGLIGSRSSGKAVPLPEGEGSSEEPYLLTSVEQLAWFAMRVNSGKVMENLSLCAAMTSNMDLFGTPYTGITRTDSPDNIDDALLWIPLANYPRVQPNTGYSGTFDGGYFYIENMLCDAARQSGSPNAGFMAGLGNSEKPGYVKNLGIQSGKVKKAGVAGAGIVGEMVGNGTRIQNCWNGALVEDSGYAGGIVALMDNGDDMTVEGCYNVAPVGEDSATGSKSSYAGGIVGMSYLLPSFTVRNCYNMGKLTGLATGLVANLANTSLIQIDGCYNGSSSPMEYPIAGSDFNNYTVRNCYYDNRGAKNASNAGTALTEAQLKSWPAAFALNGYGLESNHTKNSDWTWKTGEYPALSWAGKSGAEKLGPAENWDVIGAGVEAGLIGKRGSGEQIKIPEGSGSRADPYQIENPEQLAWFAGKVRKLTGDLSAELKAYIDLGGDPYVTSGILPWVPIGGGSSVIYKGVFNGSGYMIDRMKVETAGYAGLFAMAGEGAYFRHIGIGPRSTVTTTGPDGKGQAATAALVACAYSTAAWKADNKDLVKQSIVIEGCYSRAAITGYETQYTGTFVGKDDNSSSNYYQVIKGCYAAGPVSNGYALAGTFDGTSSTGGFYNCYWDTGIMGSISSSSGAPNGGTINNIASAVGKTTAEMKAEALIGQLNAPSSTAFQLWIYNDQSSSKVNDGYPILKTANLIKTWAQVETLVAPIVLNPAEAASTYGTEANPYLLSSPEDLAWFAKEVSGGKTELCAKMVADIDLFGSKYSGVGCAEDGGNITEALEWIPIGYPLQNYKGTFDGNGHHVSNLYIAISEGNLAVGFISMLGDREKGGIIKDFGIESGKISGPSVLGAIAGQTTRSQILRCFNGASIVGNTGMSYIGGITGWAVLYSGGTVYSTLIEGCYNTGAVSGSGNYLGGIAGGAYFKSGTEATVLRNCYNLGTVTSTGSSPVAGISGSNSVKIENCYNAGVCLPMAGSYAICVGSSSDFLKNCYYDSSKSGRGYGGSDAAGVVRGLTTAQLKTWGAAYALNGYGMETAAGANTDGSAASSWTWKEGEFPSLCWSGDSDYEETKLNAENWSQIGEGVANQLIGDRTTGILAALPEGDGSSTNPYKLANEEQLAWFGYMWSEKGYHTKHAQMQRNMDLYGSTYTGVAAGNIDQALRWIPMGKKKDGTTAGARYQATFDGKGFTVSNLLVKETSYGVGFIAAIDGESAVVKDLGVESGKVTNTAGNTGGVLGLMDKYGKVLRCWNGATVKGDSWTGGVVGTMSNTEDATVEGCYNMGNIFGGTYTGGVIGGNGNTKGKVNIRNCGNVGNVTANLGASGVMNTVSGTDVTVSNCYNAGVIRSTDSNIGAIAAKKLGTVTNCYYDKTKFPTAGKDITNAEARALTPEQLKSWAAAYALNGYGIDQTDAAAPTTESAWTYLPTGGTPVYPTICWPGSADADAPKKLGAPDSWADIGLGMDGGLIGDRASGTVTPLPSGNGSSGSPYLLTSAEDLSWFAYRVNAGKTEISGRMTGDIDLFGTAYTGVVYNSGTNNISEALKWNPMGQARSSDWTKGYQGIFDGNGFDVSNMKADSERGGFVDTLGAPGGTGIIRNFGVKSGEISGRYAAGIAGLVIGSGSKIQGCWNGADVRSNKYEAGGIIGMIGYGWERVSDVTVEGCYNRGKVTSASDGMATVYIGGIVGRFFETDSSVIRNCYNRGTVTLESGKEMGLGGIVGADTAASAGTVVKNCYNAGNIQVSSATAGAIVGNGKKTVENCYYDPANSTGSTGAGNGITEAEARSLTTVQLRSWAAAYALNGYGMRNAESAYGSFSWKIGEYPSLCSSNLSDFDTKKLQPAESWEVIGQGVKDGLIGDSTTKAVIPEPAGNGGATPYQIENPEQLAWFAHKVNSAAANGGLKADLTRDMNLLGTPYGGTDADRIRWTPIGKTSSLGYRGTFGVNQEKVYQIQNLYVGKVSVGGLFGYLMDSAQVTRLGLVNPVIGSSDPALRGTWGGSIAGKSMGSGVTVSRCYSRNAKITVGGVGGVAGGIIGVIENGGLIEDCYNLDSTIISQGTVDGSASSAGGIAGKNGASIKNCYNVGSTITANELTHAGTASSIGSDGTIQNCYSDVSLSDASKVTASVEKTQEQTDKLNKMDGTERLGDVRVWYTSLANEGTRGYPSLDAPMVLTTEVDPAAAVTGSTGTLTGGTLPSSMLLRGFHQENGTAPAPVLTGKAEAAEKYSTYGYENANKNISLLAGTTDLEAIMASASLTNPAQAVSGFTQMTLYNAAAYTAPERILILDLCDTGKTTRYEVRIKVKDPASKTVSLVFPVNPVNIELEPGMNRKSESGAVTVTNENDYPVSGRISGVSTLAGKDLELQPILSKLDSINENQDLAEAGVKLGISGIAGGTEKYYYNPADGESWAVYNIAGKQKAGENQLNFHYFMEYSPLYAGPEQTFGYTIRYSTGIAKEDVERATMTEDTAGSGS